MTNENDITWQDTYLPISSIYDDKYYSEDDGLMEAQYLYLEHNNLVARWKFCREFRVAELGFGTGLNFFATWNLWKRTAHPNAKLHYISVEKYPLSPEQIAHAIGRWPQLAPLKEKFLTAYRQPTSGFHKITFDDDHVELTLLIGDARDCLSQFNGQIDAWFLDGFAPHKNPEMWSEAVFKEISRLSSPNASVTTFTSAGFVKRHLQNAGFKTEKFAGFGPKKEMLKGKKGSDKKRPALKPKTALVIGGGLAGCSVAHSLARRGIKVNLLDREAELASKASSNRIGIFTPLLTAEPHDLGEFSFIAYRYLLDVLRRLPEVEWKNTGVLKLALSSDEETRYQRAIKVAGGSNDLIQWVNSEKASEIAGIKVDHSAVYLPEAGWIFPKSLCSELTKSPNITTQFETEVLKIDKPNNIWRAETKNKSFEADVVVIANAFDALRFDQTSWLPLRPVRGQALQIESKNELQALKTVISYDGYLAPEVDGAHMLGATYDRDNPLDGVREKDSLELIERLKNALPCIQDPKIQSARVGIRTSTPGQTPIIGPCLNKNGKSLSDIYISLGHGSRGLSFAPLSGEIIASQVCGEAIPMSSNLLYVCSAQRHWDRILKQAS
jgi:tRNA 5-methylaminomethyl-2-thiouridine biosynthesis bifunctional protein